ncbi:MAG: sugar phosphate isomerase/epimerase family protein [Coriobacteriales bacterium]|jgi:sugar phosphate isomerase/epimerase
MLNIGIDTYCFHRLFGEVYDTQEQPKYEWTIDDFLDFAKSVEADGVSIQTCFLPNEDEEYLRELGAKLDDYGFKKRIYAWGHPAGLEGGSNEKMLENLKEKIPLVKLLGTDVMRVAGGGYMLRREDHNRMVEDQIRMFKEAAKVAEENGVKLAMENHNDLMLHEVAKIVDGVNSDSFGVTFDTLNWIRVGDDPRKAWKLFGDKIFAVHMKDGELNPSLPPDDWTYFSSVPAGWGVVDCKGFMGFLKSIDYDGLIAIEFDNYIPELDGYEEEAVSICIKNLRRMRADLER